MPAATLHLVIGGDHSFNIRRASVTLRGETRGTVMDDIVRWIRAVI